MSNETEKAKDVKETEAAKETKEISQQDIDEIVAAHKRRTALILYLLVLFMAAMVFVVFSMLSQNKKLTNTNASALDRAQALQDENRNLQKDISDRDERISQLEAEKESYLPQIEAYPQLEADYNDLQQQAEELQNENKTLQQQLTDKDKASDLLLQAQTALAEKDSEAFSEAMAQLAPLSELLSTEQTKLYTQLLSNLEEP